MPKGAYVAYIRLEGETIGVSVDPPSAFHRNVKIQTIRDLYELYPSMVTRGEVWANRLHVSAPTAMRYLDAAAVKRTRNKPYGWSSKLRKRSRITLAVLTAKALRLPYPRKFARKVTGLTPNEVKNVCDKPLSGFVPDPAHLTPKEKRVLLGELQKLGTDMARQLQVITKMREVLKND